MINRIAKQLFPQSLYDAIQRGLSKKAPEICKLPSWQFVENGILQGRELFLDTNGGYYKHEIIAGYHDQFFFDYLNNIDLHGELFTINGATIWDVGAHIGYHSLSFAALVGSSGSVIAFEPNPFNADRFRFNLSRNTDLGARITLLDFALSDVEGEEDFVISSDIGNGYSSGSHLEKAFAPEDPQAYQSYSQTRIRVETADALLRDERVPPPSIIKIDVEGAESLVLSGAQYILTNLRPILLIEVHHISAMHEVLNILLRFGYYTRILNDAPNSSSRCFMVAQPEKICCSNKVTDGINKP